MSLFPANGMHKSRKKRSGSTQNARRRCLVELLEDRRMLAQDIWVGNGDGRTWLDGQNWESGQVPGLDAEVIIPQLANTASVLLPSSGTIRLKSIQSEEPLVLAGATLSIAEASSIQQLTFSSGTLTGDAELEVNGLMEWRGGQITGTSSSGNIILKGGLSITSGSRALTGRTMILDSNTRWTAGTWQINGGATIINEPTRVLDIANVFLDDTDAQSIDKLINRGILRKSSNSGAAILEFDLLELEAGARVEASVGTIHVSGSFHSAGHWQVAEGALIDWNKSAGKSELRSGTTSAGTGHVRLSNGEPSAPSINTAFAMPGTTSSPLAMLFPAQGKLGIQLTTTGISDAAIAAMTQFVSDLLDGSIEFGAAIFDAALTELAAVLESERVRRQATSQWSTSGRDIPSKLLHIIVDENEDDVLSSEERAVAIDRERLIDRIQALLQSAPSRAGMLTESLISGLLDAATRFMGSLEPDDERIVQLNEMNQGNALSKLTDLLETLPINYYQPPVGNLSQEWPSMPQATTALEPLYRAAEHSKEIYAAFAYHVQKAILASAETFFEIADPAITISGELQPYLLNLQVPESVLGYPGWLNNIVTALSTIDTPGQFQLFAPSIAAGLTLNLENPCDGIAPDDCNEELRILRDTDKIEEIVSDAYVEGTWEGKLLGISLGKARVDGTTKGLEIELEDPLLGLMITVLASMDERTINKKTVSFPRAKAEVTLDTEQAIGLLDQLNLPDQLRQDFVDAQGTLRWYSPGYSSATDEPDRLKRVGGIEAQATLNADLFDVFEAGFLGTLTSTGDFAFAANDLTFSFPFPLGAGTISGNADFSLTGTLGSTVVDFQGNFSGRLMFGRNELATARGAIDTFGCLRGSITYLNGSGTVTLPDHALKPGACGAQLYVDEATFTETDVDTLHHITVRLSEPADHHVNINYTIEVVSGNNDPRDKATDKDVVVKQNQTLSKVATRPVRWIWCRATAGTSSLH